MISGLRTTLSRNGRREKISLTWTLSSSQSTSRESPLPSRPIKPTGNSLHWFLAVIYNPAGILRQRPPSPEPPPKPKTRANASVAQDADIDIEMNGLEPEPEVVHTGGRSPSYELQHLDEGPESAPTTGREGTTSPAPEKDQTGDISGVSHDELDIIDQPIADDRNMSRVSDQVTRMAINVVHPDGEPSPGQPIRSETFDVWRSQRRDPPEEPARVPLDAKGKGDAQIWESQE